jgi:hypothetical protein
VVRLRDGRRRQVRFGHPLGDRRLGQRLVDRTPVLAADVPLDLRAGAESVPVLVRNVVGAVGAARARLVGLVLRRIVVLSEPDVGLREQLVRVARLVAERHRRQVRVGDGAEFELVLGDPLGEFLRLLLFAPLVARGIPSSRGQSAMPSPSRSPFPRPHRSRCTHPTPRSRRSRRGSVVCSTCRGREYHRRGGRRSSFLTNSHKTTSMVVQRTCPVAIHSLCDTGK